MECVCTLDNESERERERMSINYQTSLITVPSVYFLLKEDEVDRMRLIPPNATISQSTMHTINHSYK